MAEVYFQIPHQLPPLKEGTNMGLWAQPDRTVTLAAVPASGATSIVCQGYSALVDRGDWHLARDGRGLDHFRAIDFTTAREPGQTYQILRELEPEEDERAAFLRQFWLKRFACSSTIYEVRRVAPIMIVGQIADEAVGKRIKGRHDWFTLEPNMWLVRSLVNDHLWWILGDADLHKDFTRLTTPLGELMIDLRS